MRSMRELSDIFKALSDPNRIRILKMLEVKSLCVCEMTEILQLATSTVSKHLSILRSAGLITDQKDGKWVNYSLNNDSAEKHINQILSLLREWLPDNATVLADRKKLQTVDRIELCNLS